MTYPRKMFFLGASVFLVSLLVQSPVRSATISEVDDYNSTEELFPDIESVIQLLQETNTEVPVSLENSTRNPDMVTPTRLKDFTMTVSSKRDSRSSQPQPSLWKNPVRLDSLEDSEEERHQLDQMTGSVSKNDFSPSLPVIQKLIPSRKLAKKNESMEMLSLEDLLDIYSATRLATVWNRTQDLHVTPQCYDDMTVYLQALKRADIWALEMSDASGRYGGGFLWGNNYWVGSATLCRQIRRHTPHPPPFTLGFYVLRSHIMLDKHITPQARSQLLGVCLPRVCSPRDVTQLVELSAREARLDTHRDVNIVTIKSPQEEYLMSEDPVFFIIVVSCVLVGLMLVVGTALDVYRQRAMASRANFTYDNYTFVFTKSAHCSITTAAGPGPLHGTNKMADNNNGGRSVTEGRAEASEPSTESNSVTSDETVLKTGLLTEILLSFSVTRNLKAICDQSVGADTIPTVHGLRSISMGWVILGHTCIVAFKYSDNMSYRGVVEREFLFQTINNGAFSVDTFFFISGLLVSFLYFRTTAKHDINKITRTKGFVTNILQFIGMIAYRFCRLTSPYLFVLGVVQVSMKWFHHNSVFEPPAADHINCPQYWWRNLLYINTLFPVKDMCMLWSWYLADDTQFFVLGTILLIMAVKNFRAAASLMLVFLASSWMTTMYIAYSNKHMPNLDDPLALFDKIYDKPWTRLGPYMVGMSVGWFLFKTDCKIKMSKWVVAVGWSSSVALLLFLVYGLYEQELHPITAAAYSSLSHTLWAAGLAWVVIACSAGYGGYVNRVLSSTILYPFSRVTYCAYLVHPILIRIVAMKMDSPIHLGKDLVIIMFFGVLVISYILSLVVSLAFEAPAVALLKIVSFKRKSK